MKINELRPGANVRLSIEVENEGFEIDTIVVGTDATGALVEPVIYKDKVIEIKSLTKKTIVFNLYAQGFDGNRLGWFNVDCDKVDYKGKSYYAIHPKKFSTESKPAERRGNNRLKLHDIPGKLSAAGKDYDITINDISTTGISFHASKDLDLPFAQYVIKFEDKVRDEVMRLSIACKYVRYKTEEDKTLYGCVISDPDRTTLSYIFLKPLFDIVGADDQSMANDIAEKMQ